MHRALPRLRRARRHHVHVQRRGRHIHGTPVLNFSVCAAVGRGRQRRPLLQRGRRRVRGGRAGAAPRAGCHPQRRGGRRRACVPRYDAKTGRRAALTSAKFSVQWHRRGRQRARNCGRGGACGGGRGRQRRRAWRWGCRHMGRHHASGLLRREHGRQQCVLPGRQVAGRRRGGRHQRRRGWLLAAP